jgi:hypothetical protein
MDWMDLEWWKIAAALLGPGSTLALVVGFVRKLLLRRDRARLDRGYANIQRAYKEIQELLSGTNANRVLILISENGGGVPSPGAKVKGSVRFEVCGSQSKPVQNDWQNVLLDSTYSDVMSTIASKGIVDVYAEKLDSESFLFNIFKSFNTSRARMVRVLATDKLVLYLSVHFHKTSPLSAQEIVRINKTARTLFGIFKKHYPILKEEGGNNA